MKDRQAKCPKLQAVEFWKEVFELGTVLEQGDVKKAGEILSALAAQEIERFGSACCCSGCPDARSEKSLLPN